jgi:predicted DNA-binding ribbon-helix-helix protein
MQKRSITLDGHRTSLALEPAFWAALAEVAAARGVSVPTLVAEIDRGRGGAGLASAIRTSLLEHYRRAGAGAITGP